MAGQTSSGVGRFEALDAMRGICALLVVLFHIPIYHALKGTQPFVNLQFCVDMFFALSGFVLCHAYGQRLHQAGDGVRFMAMRFARLWPLHMVMLALFVMIEVSKIIFMRTDGSFSLDSVPFGAGHTLYEAVTNILFLQSFNLHGGLTWNGPAWSAAVEFYVSMLFAVIVVLFPRRRREIFLGLCLAAGMQLYERSPGTLFVSSDWGMLRAMFSFFAGCLVYDLRLYSNGRLDMPNILEVSCAVLVAVFVLVTPSGGPQYLFPLLAAVVICVFSFDQGKISAVLRSPALQKVGLWSYSIYMIHTFIFQIMRSAASFLGHKLHLELVAWHNDDKLVVLGTPTLALVAALVLSVVLVVPVAALTYRWIEKPAMDAARRALSSASRAEAPVDAVSRIGFGAAIRRLLSAGVIRTAAGFRAARLRLP
ncbi:acyltransferase [Bradyrhizobium neotropicale]|uniref:acyltransferase family protein n=1 Tax=Bradyrhizobium neotropicale TaxID=1497615 RepID=UPI001AD7E06E|nr:acyltransferase [Bradyrhizobium neotropicale]MBO4225420.1 acyltransferase family protein [Bradyrhizobium neotropicale]